MLLFCKIIKTQNLFEIIVFEICLKIFKTIFKNLKKIFKTIFKNLKKIFKTIFKKLKKILRKFNDRILSEIVKVLNSLSILYCK